MKFSDMFLPDDQLGVTEAVAKHYKMPIGFIDAKMQYQDVKDVLSTLPNISLENICLDSSRYLDVKNDPVVQKYYMPKANQHVDAISGKGMYIRNQVMSDKILDHAGKNNSGITVVWAGMAHVNGDGASLKPVIPKKISTFEQSLNAREDLRKHLPVQDSFGNLLNQKKSSDDKIIRVVFEKNHKDQFGYAPSTTQALLDSASPSVIIRGYMNNPVLKEGQSLSDPEKVKNLMQSYGDSKEKLPQFKMLTKQFDAANDPQHAKKMVDTLMDGALKTGFLEDKNKPASALKLTP
jgi:hypothetical protein